MDTQVTLEISFNHLKHVFLSIKINLMKGCAMDSTLHIKYLTLCLQIMQINWFEKSWQQILPIKLQGTFLDKVSSVLINLCGFFHELCAKALKVHELKQLEAKIAITLCQMEEIFTPSLFTVMVYLVVHLAYEAKIARPVHY